MKYSAVNELTIKGVLMAVVIGLSGCSSNDGEQLPPGASIDISPASSEWTIVANNQTDANGLTRCVMVDDFYQDELVSVSVLDSQGRGIEDAELIFSLNLAGNTFSGHPALSLYNDVNKNFVADPEELVSSAENDLFVARTDEYSGSKYVIVRLNLSCPYKGVLRVFSNGISGVARFDVLEEEQEQL